MNKKSSWAKNWLNTTDSQPTTFRSNENDRELPSIPSIPKIKEQFPINQLVPGWTGDALLSKNSVLIKNFLNVLLIDAEKQFTESSSLTISLQKAIFEEFLGHAHYNRLNFDDIDDYKGLFKQINNKHSKYTVQLKNFKREFCFRTVVIYLHKIRFVTALAKSIDLQVEEKDLINPSSLWSKIFKEKSSTELKSKVFKPNRYSWYRPHDNIGLSKLGPILNTVSETELNKIFTFTPDTDKLDFINSEYAHCLSHSSFGLFLNYLMKDFAKWISDQTDLTILNQQSHDNKLNCKFSGNFSNSIISAHNLAQEILLKNDHLNIVIPRPSDQNLFYGKFQKVCQEFRLMTTLAKTAISKKLNSVELICNSINGSYNSFNERKSEKQFSIFDINSESEQIDEDNAIFDRIVLNLSEMPKTNPHHHLINRIKKEQQSLARNGQLIVLSNQKLFVPSQGQKVQQLFKNIQLLANIDLNGVKGKGKVPAYIYIFRSENNINYFNQKASQKREQIYSFVFRGTLKSFHKFSSLTQEIKNFTERFQSSTASIFHKEIDQNLSFSFHQDAIIDGKLIHSADNSDPTKITHPTFFKNITKNCIPLNSFFFIEQLSTTYNDRDDRDHFTSKLFNLNDRPDNRHHFVAIVDYRDSSDIKVELIKAGSYEAYLEKYGSAFYQYFGLTPKLPQLNINAFREFFYTNIGKQIIQITLNGQTGLKSKFTNLLAPRFLALTDFPTDDVISQLDILSLSPEDIRKLHPDQISSDFVKIKQLMDQLPEKFNSFILNILITFQTNLASCIDIINKGHPYKSKLTNSAINFQGPLIADQLAKVETYPIYPNNKDIFIEFVNPNPADIHSPFSSTKIGENKDGKFLIVKSATKDVVKLYADPTLLSFIDFIIQKAKNSPISLIAQHMKIPRTDQLIEILKTTDKLDQSMTTVYKDVSKYILNIFLKEISATKNWR